MQLSVPRRSDPAAKRDVRVYYGPTSEPVDIYELPADGPLTVEIPAGVVASLEVIEMIGRRPTVAAPWTVTGPASVEIVETGEPVAFVRDEPVHFPGSDMTPLVLPDAALAAMRMAGIEVKVEDLEAAGPEAFANNLPLLAKASESDDEPAQA